ncbi:Uncharacterized protein MK1359 [Methanopyrus kandleri AV19]|uniref:Uncharacterized protein n=1 Tax=Methanopyrus kandleri (strain AV19 / DSM 6324 / JCM 9639 / NBRC 100938) TaxID=190192 RepID=Q8TVM9_METKA|nr:Uncharacterized protein MK1359 [Methanopyrus kandleri AV19]
MRRREPTYQVSLDGLRESTSALVIPPTRSRRVYALDRVLERPHSVLGERVGSYGQLEGRSSQSLTRIMETQNEIRQDPPSE